MRNVLVALLAVAATAGCGPQPPSADVGAQAGAAVSASFPDLFQAAYRAEALMTLDDGSITPVLMIRDAAKVRVEMSVAEAPSVSVRDHASGEGFVINVVSGRPVVTRQTAGQTPNAPEMWWDGDIAASMSRVGDCSHLGQRGAEWERARVEGPQHACVTDDGIVLWATNNGRTIWQLASLQRGPQDASLFAAPARRVREEEGQTEAQGDAAPENYTPPQFRTEPPPQAQ